MRSTQTGFFDNLVAAAKENPLAAVLIGGGALWLMAGDDRIKGAARSTAAAASGVVDGGVSTMRTAASAIQRTAAPPTAPEMDHIGSLDGEDTLQSAKDAASGVLSGTADKMRAQFEDGLEMARDGFAKVRDQIPGGEAVSKAKSSLSDVLEKQPLVLGVVGLAIGAAVAGAFRTTDIENEYVGETSDAVKADLNSRVGAVSQALRENSDTLLAEVSDTGGEALDRIRQTGMDAVEAARERAKSPNVL
ncbi:MULTISPECIES: hypothetical protein [unclassified Bradyrhizobium]|jgi:ElaB/YqjD/DUF883 family membrane-anchored ribosome-binding protein|uniref:hypothetical protein n=1 Tax=unclassified Bradyrhizobium TaxID=2631580 RepID=UPI001FF8FB74|nr:MULTISPECIES: hypothetical protein [unclassified Bradyrhizobium]MCK1510896.1 hypothetical protein [Bradyrhizobium sp. 18]MCK1576928.1 hypothetical protein [Bradyrhizobium sp. 174]MCK1662099.1 hypothetical protein [Bradyrhizobium sp. 151]UPJ29771.1 hypothetical protein IVB54_12560 [Bradyrhizobium sp. CW1]UPJ82671.1 hypothetical protein IVB17_12340 [Bradyrhizobium sp. 184]